MHQNPSWSGLLELGSCGGMNFLHGWMDGWMVFFFKLCKTSIRYWGVISLVFLMAWCVVKIGIVNRHVAQEVGLLTSIFLLFTTPRSIASTVGRACIFGCGIHETRTFDSPNWIKRGQIFNVAFVDVSTKTCNWNTNSKSLKWSKEAYAKQENKPNYAYIRSVDVIQLLSLIGYLCFDWLVCGKVTIIEQTL